VRATANLFTLTGALALLTATTVVWGSDIPEARAAPASTVVTLTFDDGDADQYDAAQTMAEHDLPATFYITTSWIGSDGYLTREQLDAIAEAGHEIGGHTVNHPDLAAIPLAEVEAEVCNGRAVLESWGYPATNFSYPFMRATPEVEQIAAACGYDTARGLGDIASAFACQDCPVAETMPPLSPHYLRAPAQIDAAWTLEHMKAAVTNAVHSGGGWVMLTFHRVCAPTGAGCPADRSTSPELFTAFSSWLAAFRDDPANGTAVQTVAETVRQYLGADHAGYRPARAAESSPAAPEGVNALSNPSLEDVDPTTGLPACWHPGGWGANTPRWETVSPGRTGNIAQHLEVSAYTDGDAKLLPALDLKTCAPTAEPGANYEVSAWYRSTGRSQFILYYRNASYEWVPWISSPWIEPEPTTWTRARFVTPPAPVDATGISFGLSLVGAGTLTTDDYALVRTSASGVVAPPVQDEGRTRALWASPQFWGGVTVLVLLILLYRAPAGHRSRVTS
jgi:peptidoglycan/xylan/chitin deacetylase (PgdA/CDA1 family)